jgi:hypothetical protein
MARLRDGGLTLAEIGARLGLSRQAVHIVLARSGYRPPERPDSPTPGPAKSDRPANEPAKAPQPGTQAEVREVTVEAMNTFANRSRPRVDGDKRTDRCRAVKLLPGYFGRSARSAQRRDPNLLRRVGPQRAEHIVLGASVEVTNVA